MNFISIRELKTQAAKIWIRLEKDHDLVLTNHGKPVAVLVETGEKDLERTLADLKAMRGLRALEDIQAQSAAKGLDKMTLAEINAEITASRQERRRKSGKHERRH